MPAANNIPTDALVKVLTALVKHAPFETAGQAGRALMGCGLVCKTWQEAASHDAVWRALFLRCSPALVRARDGVLCECPSGGYITTTDDDESDEEWERRSDAETVANRAFITLRSEAYESDGAIYQLSIAWRDFPGGTSGHALGTSGGALVDNLYSNVTPDPVYRHDEDDSDYEEITEHLRNIEAKLARLHWT